MFAKSMRHGVLLCGALLSILFVPGCPPPMTADPNDPNDSTAKTFGWRRAFQSGSVGALSGVWGTGPQNIFVVGGDDTQGEVYHFDGTTWSGMTIPEVPLLVWVFGFAENDVWAVGVGGGVLHYDGSTWTRIDAGTTDDLWGIWGNSPNDFWVVGGRTGVGDPVILHYDGNSFTPFDVPANDRNATSLFKIWGIGSKTFAVGENGLIIEWNGTGWNQVSSGAAADEDFVSLWGTSEDNIVAVGGRSSGRIATYDGTTWTTVKPDGTPGLNAVFMTSPTQCVVGGQNGYVGVFDPSSGGLTAETSNATLDVHAMYGFGEIAFGVGGRFSPPYAGLALIRDAEDLAPAAAPSAVTVIPDDTSNPAPVVDCNNNGVEDADEIASGAAADCDGNGVPDACDPDGDADGVPDACDACLAGDDDADADGDGVADACDACPGSDDSADADSDGTPDGCDLCPGSDDRDDADDDGVPDGCDICPGADDTIDSDGDGVPNGCDVCDGADQADDDNDGVPNDCDICPGGDDRIDGDGDGQPDFCDPCPVDANDDSDGDGYCDSVDVCPGGDDDGPDRDGDGIVDDCDCFESDCPVGQECVDGSCQPVAGPDLQIGAVDPDDPNLPFAVGEDWSELRIFRGFQSAALYDLWTSGRVTGFDPDVQVTVRLDIFLLSDPETDIGNGLWLTRLEPDAQSGVQRIPSIFILAAIVYPPEVPLPLCDAPAILRVTVTDALNADVFATSEIYVILKPEQGTNILCP